MKLSPKLRKLERIMMAVTFAEANEHDTALECMAESDTPAKQQRKEKAARVQSDNRPQLRM